VTRSSSEDKRLAEILEIIFEFAAGNLKARGTLLDGDSAIDGVMAGINILGEELEASTEEIKQANDSLRKSLDFAQALIRSSPDGIIAVDRDLAITEWNRNMELISGMAREQAIGCVVDEIPFMRESGEAARIHECIRGDQCKPWEFVYRIHGKNVQLHFESSIASLTENDGTIGGAVLRITDITERKHAERAEMLAHRDELTGLNNRRAFDELLEKEIARTRRVGRSTSLMMIDIDYFKRVNDSHGHQAGDAILRGFGDVLLRQSRINDHVCRYGGEEFSIILPETSAARALRSAKRLCGKVKRWPFDIGGDEIGITISIGVATYPQHTDSQKGLVKAADTALYAAKRAGRDQAVCYGPPLAGHSSAA